MLFTLQPLFACAVGARVSLSNQNRVLPQITRCRAQDPTSLCRIRLIPQITMVAIYPMQTAGDHKLTVIEASLSVLKLHTRATSFLLDGGSAQACMLDNFLLLANKNYERVLLLTPEFQSFLLLPNNSIESVLLLH